MKMKFFSILLALIFTSCTTYQFTPVVHNNNFSLKDIDFGKDFKSGEACAELDGISSEGKIVFEGSKSIIDAAKEGGIKHVVLVDFLS